VSDAIVQALVMLAAVALICGATLTAWRDWLAYARERGGGSDAGDDDTVALAIELAALRDRVRQLERLLPAGRRD
jgi:transposase-like protein